MRIAVLGTGTVGRTLAPTFAAGTVVLDVANLLDVSYGASGGRVFNTKVVR